MLTDFLPLDGRLLVILDANRMPKQSAGFVKDYPPHIRPKLTPGVSRKPAKKASPNAANSGARSGIAGSAPRVG